jgi:methyl-accepting chemotaxis protein
MTSLHSKSTAKLLNAVISSPAGSTLPQPSPKMKRQQKMSIRVVVITSLIVPMVTAVGLTGWLSIRNGQKAVDEMAGRLQTEVGNRVSTHLDSYLSAPYQLNQLNLSAISLGAFKLDDFNTLGKYFWQQMRAFNVGYINFANEDGEFIGVERLDDNQLLINEVSQRSTQGQLYVYQTDNQGNRTRQQDVKTYDPRQEAWYTDAVKAKRPLWTSIYQWEDKPEILSISSSYPVYGTEGKFKGVIGVDLILSQVSRFLNQLNVSPSTRIFIVERDGFVVGNSGNSKSYTVDAGKSQRVKAEASSDELIRAAAQYLNQSLGGFGQIQTSQLATFTFQGTRQFVQVTPWKDQRGLDWRIVVVTSESDFMAQINANTQNTIILCSLALLAASLVGFLVSRWIADPVVRLSQAAQAIAAGNLNQSVETQGIGEVGVLADSFNQMAHQLRQSFTALEGMNQDLEQRVADRTATLHAESQTLQQEVGHLLEVVSAIEEGDLTVAAEVSPYATGLVADTLNRLVERLEQIMATVFNAAEQVTQGAKQVEMLTLTVATDIQQQTQSVTQVQTLMENLEALAQTAALKAIATDEAVELTQSAILQGQTEAREMTQGIEGLQQTTNQIVNRTETLTSYVGLAAQFTKDQQRIAAMTRVLAVNASMLASRASAQQDPAQLAIVTREFETIAVQVNQVATQTNHSMMQLQQRTNQIQTVVSGLSHDVQEISQEVHHLTQGVLQSQQAFNTIQSVNEQVAQLGQQVTQFSQAIANAAQTTLQSIREIAAVSAEALDRADATQHQVQQMEQLAQALLQKTSFFRLQPQSLSTLKESSFLILPPPSFSQNGTPK